MIAKILKLAGVGFLMGAIVGVCVVILESFAFGGGAIVLPSALVTKTGSQAGALLAQMLLSGAYGIVPMVGTVLYDLDEWGLLKQAVVHYLSYTAAFFLVAIYAGWFPAAVEVMGLMAGIFAVIHAIIWAIMYARYKSEVRQLNELLQGQTTIESM